MKKIILGFILILTSCANGFGVIPPSKTIKNDKCENIQEYEILQVLDSGALANACDYSDMGYRSCSGLIVFVPNLKGLEYYDDKVVKNTKDKCISYKGVYKYESQDGRQRTVPKLKFINNNIPNPAYKEWLKNNGNKK